MIISSTTVDVLRKCFVGEAQHGHNKAEHKLQEQKTNVLAGGANLDEPVLLV